MDNKVSNGKVIKFDPCKRKESQEEVLKVFSLGYIQIDLSLSIDGTSISFTPSCDLEDDISNEICDALNEMLKKGFPEAIDYLFELYKSGN